MSVRTKGRGNLGVFAEWLKVHGVTAHAGEIKQNLVSGQIKQKRSDNKLFYRDYMRDCFLSGTSNKICISRFGQKKARLSLLIC